MASYNLVVLAGNLTRDVDLRHIASGTAVADVTVAVNEKRKTPNGEWVEDVSFVDVTLWGRTAEVASEYLGKGSNLLIEGRLKLDRWEKDGQKHSKLRVVCERMVMLGSRGDRGGQAGQGGTGAAQGPQSSDYREPVAELEERAAPTEAGPSEGGIPF
ncbi:MAG: single-stranded DNA-binding protein [Planctomycetia bacterium]|nr:single-stranded DNA-binding protein [Planctomycetia bacterium]